VEQTTSSNAFVSCECLWPIGGKIPPKALSTLATIVAGNGDKFGNSSPFSVTVAEFGDYSRQCGQGLTHAQEACASFCAKFWW